MLDKPAKAGNSGNQHGNVNKDWRKKPHKVCPCLRNVWWRRGKGILYLECILWLQRWVFWNLYQCTSGFCQKMLYLASYLREKYLNIYGFKPVQTKSSNFDQKWANTRQLLFKIFHIPISYFVMSLTQREIIHLGNNPRYECSFLVHIAL